MIFDGRITRVVTGGVHVVVPDLGGLDFEFGPCIAAQSPTPYAVGDRVTVGLRRGRPDDPVVLGKL